MVCVKLLLSKLDVIPSVILVIDLPRVYHVKFFYLPTISIKLQLASRVRVAPELSSCQFWQGMPTSLFIGPPPFSWTIGGTRIPSLVLQGNLKLHKLLDTRFYTVQRSARKKRPSFGSTGNVGDVTSKCVFGGWNTEAE